MKKVTDITEPKGGHGSKYRAKRGGRRNSRNYNTMGEGKSTAGGPEGCFMPRND